MWIGRVALISFFLLLTVQTICVQLDTPEEERADWFYVLSPLWWFFGIVFVLLLVGWGECCCIVCADPDVPPSSPAAEILDIRRRQRKPSDGASLTAGTVTWAVFLTISILLAVFLNGDSYYAGVVLVIIFIVYQVLALLYLFAVSYYNTLRKETGHQRLSYASCFAIALRFRDPPDSSSVTDQQFEDLSVCGDAGVGRCKCTAGWADDKLTWIDALQAFFIYTLLVGLFASSLLLLVSLTSHPLLTSIILSPLYIAITALILNGFCLIYQITNRRKGGYEFTTYFIYFGSLILLLAFLILLAIKIDADSIDTWFYVFLPLTIALAATTIGSCTILCCPACRKATGREPWGVLARVEAQETLFEEDVDHKDEFDELEL